jgi:hypothetical protein
VVLQKKLATDFHASGGSFWRMTYRESSGLPTKLTVADRLALSPDFLTLLTM